ncbi:Rid family hydrolase [Isoptericola sp. NPDC019482]|uniref:RidA family protein n=1 Tax=Isoptericola sp. NPDC019482 TaxID=3154688 RepID=UPI003494626A
MTVDLRTPPGMFQPVPYHHVAVGTGARHVHVAGQVARDAEGRPVAADDLAGQVAQALRNTARGLAGAGAGFDDVVRLRFLVVGWQPEKYGDLAAGIEEVVEELGIPQPWPPATLVGVESLFEPDVLVEVEATAVLD